MERCWGQRGKHARRCRATPYSPRSYNPSVVRAPTGLCQRCHFVVAVRVSSQHQCTPKGALEQGFVGTAIAALDARARLLAWDWWFNNAPLQLGDGAGSTERRGHRHNLTWTPSPRDTSFHHQRSDGTAAVPYPWSQHDVRLLGYPGGGSSIIATMQCRSCRSFNVLNVMVRGVASADGGLQSLRAWSAPGNRKRSFSWPMGGGRPTARSRGSWAALAGCNQALFYGPRGMTGGLRLMVQPWMAIILELGNASTRWGPLPDPFARITGGRPLSHEQQGRVAPQTWVHIAPLRTVARVRVHDDAVRKWVNATGFRWSIEPPVGTGPGDGEKAHAPLLSTTAHLLALNLSVGKHGAPPQEFLLGVAHVHRGRSTDGKAWRQAAMHGRPPPHRFRWGFDYMHAFYLLDPRSDYRIRATSSEFCIAAEAPLRRSQWDTRPACESIQMVMGIAQAGDEPRSSLLLSYGANDCKAKLGFVSLERLEAMLVPL